MATHVITAYVGVGTNLGDRWGHLAQAARELDDPLVLRVTRASRVYENPALDPRQPPYLNAVLELETDLAAEELLDRLLDAEARAGRTREVRWGPRTLDLDLLLYGEAVMRSPKLTVPHPGLLSRRFVLGPLAELRPDLVVPGTGKSVADLLRSAPPHPMTSAGLYPGLPAGTGAQPGR